MSAEDKKSTTPTSIPRWEAELWSCVGHGDGMRCPLQGRCRFKEKSSWCPDDNRERLNWLFDEKEFNLRNFDFVKPEGSKQCRMIQLVERLSQKYLRMGNVLCPPVSTELVALFDQEHTVEIRQLSLKVYHGAIWYHKDGWIIQVNDSDAAPTMRLTAFHEAFHILAHSRTSPVFRKRGCVAGSFNELLADLFAGCIMMPREMVLEKWAEVKDLDRIAGIFAVPKSAMCLTLRKFDLI